MEQAPKILIVDDDLKMTDSLKAILNGRGYEIVATNRALTALKYLREHHFDLAILDIMMPEMSGFQIMDSLDRVNIKTMFIIMTGDASLESAIEAVRKGASDYIRKPFEPEELFIRVENVLKQKRLKDEREQIEIEKRNLENQLRQSHKMEAIGTLAGGIAHDFNNMLGIIIGNAELAIEAIPKKSHAQQYINRILAASTRAEEMINRLLSFSRQTDYERRPIKLNEIVRESLKLLRSSLPTNIEIQEKIPDTPLIISSDPTQINQIMLNLCTNAAHAMQECGGRLEILLEKKMLDENMVAGYSDLMPGQYCKLSVTDTGHGIEPELINRIFDPYFTTKESGKGTGMGLAVVHGIVKNHWGDIKVFSEPGKGTEFQIYLPLEDAVVSEMTSISTKTPPQGNERILLVDDEEMILEIMKEMLEKLGYHVSAQTSCDKALAEFSLGPEKYDLVITDMTMPHMTGDRLAQSMKEIRPDIPIVICTGFNEAINEEKSKMSGIQEFIMKPVSIKKLAKTVRKVLDSDFIDRRKSRRYRTTTESYVMLPNSTERFDIIDISECGLAFRYAMSPLQMEELETISIVIANRDFIIENIKYKTAYDIEICDASPTLDTPIRRRGVQFESLTPLQMEKIGYLIENHTSRFENQRDLRIIH